MSPENQHIEWKESWRDEYLKWIAGFANADGGKLIIGINDKGKVVDVQNAEALLETIPNKVRDILGILVNVTLVEQSALPTLEIITEGHPFPVSYRGQYFRRSGSTNQELKGNALDRFLLSKQGKRWDGVPVPGVKVSDLSTQAFDYFISKAVASSRLKADYLGENPNDLLEKLKLKEGAYIKRAAILLFHADPEQYITGAYVKIGFFNDQEILQYQDEVHGFLFEQVEKTMDLLRTKYMKAFIGYEGLHRVESFPFPEAALREALLNAVAHKDYGSGNPIQISMYDSKIIFWNSGQLPEAWTIERLKTKHSSIPFNPDIANAFFRAGLIEAWGQGIFRIMQACVESDLPDPEFHFDSSGFSIELRSRVKTGKGGINVRGKAGEKTREETREETRGKTREKILLLIGRNAEITISEMASALHLSVKGIEYHIAKLKGEKIIDRIGPDKGGKWVVLKK